MAFGCIKGGGGGEDGVHGPRLMGRRDDGPWRRG